MRIRRYRKKLDVPVLFLKIALLLALVSLCVTYFYNRIRPLIIAASAQQARFIVTDRLNSIITKELSENKLDYSQLVTVSFDSDGRVTSIQTNMATTNAFKSKIISLILSEISSIEEQTMKIPIGSLSNVPFFLGKGPKIDFKVTSAGYADARFESEFLSAGINQTCHRIKLIVTADVCALIPGFVSSTKIVTDYYIAETIIVGATPEFFANAG